MLGNENTKKKRHSKLEVSGLLEKSHPELGSGGPGRAPDLSSRVGPGSALNFESGSGRILDLSNRVKRGQTFDRVGFRPKSQPARL